jgi:hypothetical protein
LDFIHDATSSGAALKMLVVEDEFTRECLAVEAGCPARYTASPRRRARLASPVAS